MGWPACLTALSNSVWSTYSGMHAVCRQLNAIIMQSLLTLMKLSTNKIATPPVGMRARYSRG